MTNRNRAQELVDRWAESLPKMGRPDIHALTNFVVLVENELEVKDEVYRERATARFDENIADEEETHAKVSKEFEIYRQGRDQEVSDLREEIETLRETITELRVLAEAGHVQSQTTSHCTLCDQHWTDRDRDTHRDDCILYIPPPVL